MKWADLGCPAKPTGAGNCYWIAYELMDCCRVNIGPVVVYYQGAQLSFEKVACSNLSWFVAKDRRRVLELVERKRRNRQELRLRQKMWWWRDVYLAIALVTNIMYDTDRWRLEAAIVPSSLIGIAAVSIPSSSIWIVGGSMENLRRRRVIIIRWRRNPVGKKPLFFN